MAQKNYSPDTEYQTLIDIYLGKFGQWLTLLPGINTSLPYMVNAFLFNLLTLLLSYLTSLLFKESTIFKENWRVLVGGVMYTFILIVGLKHIISLVFDFIREHIDPLLEDQKDKENLAKALQSFSNITPAVTIALALFIGRGIFSFFYLDISPERGPLGVSGNLLTTITFPQLWVIIYYFGHLLKIIYEFKNFSYNIKQMDPVTSKLIENYRRLTINMIYLVSSVVFTATIVFSWAGVITPLNALFITLAGWLPLFSLFGISFYTQKQIINNTKLELIRELDNQIVTLQSKDKIPSTATLEQINQLIELQKHVKGTPDSSFDISAYLNFLTTLVIPILPSSITLYMDKITELFQQLFGIE